MFIVYYISDRLPVFSYVAFTAFWWMSFCPPPSCRQLPSKRPSVSERLAEDGWKPHRVVLGSTKPVVGLNLQVYA